MLGAYHAAVAMRDMSTKRKSIMLGVSLSIVSLVFAYPHVIVLPGATCSFATHAVPHVGQPNYRQYALVLIIFSWMSTQCVIIVQVAGSVRSTNNAFASVMWTEIERMTRDADPGPHRRVWCVH